MASELHIYHQKVLNDFREKMIKKYGSDWDANKSRLYEGKGARYMKPNAVATSIQKASYGRRMATTTQEIVSNLMTNAPTDTTYGRTNMFRKIDRWHGLVVLGVENAVGGQIIGAPYMVHVNFTAKKPNVHGWINRALVESEYVAEAERMIIWEPIFNYGMCAIKVRATENGIEDWDSEMDLEELL